MQAPPNKRLAAMALTLFLLGMPSVASAEDPITICAKSLKTQKMYHALALLLTGAKLNDSEHSVAFDPYSNYLVIGWDKTHQSIVKMDGALAAPSFVPTTGTDQAGTIWQITSYSYSTCP